MEIISLANFITKNAWKNSTNQNHEGDIKTKHNVELLFCYYFGTFLPNLTAGWEIILWAPLLLSPHVNE